MKGLREKVFLLGSTGQIGKAFLQENRSRFNLFPSSRDTLDLTKTSEISEAIKKENPGIIINCSGFTDVESAETDKKKAETLNSEVPKILAETANNLGSILIHFSTDYIFDGKKNGQYKENDKPNPLSSYGRTKLKGDKNVCEIADKYFIFRICWVYSENNKNFLTTMVNLMANESEIKVVDDQIGTPTPANFISRNVLRVIEQTKSSHNPAYGVYNLRPQGTASWYEFANKILDLLKRRNNKLLLVNKIIPISSSEFSGTAIRPPNSVLDSFKIRKLFDIETLSWDDYVLEELIKVTERMKY